MFTFREYSVSLLLIGPTTIAGDEDEARIDDDADWVNSGARLRSKLPFSCRVLQHTANNWHQVSDCIETPALSLSFTSPTH